jgi:hypothetical protein
VTDRLDELVALIADAIAPRVAELVRPETNGAASGAPAGEPWRLLDLEETAARLGRSPRWVRDHKHAIGYVRLDGGALAFDVEDLRRFARERRVCLQPLAADGDVQGFSGLPLSGEQKAR